MWSRVPAIRPRRVTAERELGHGPRVSKCPTRDQRLLASCLMDRIRALREEREWSQADLAERAGVTRQLVSAVEAGRHAPNVNAALGLARALGRSVEELFGPSTLGSGVESVVGGRIGAGTPLVTVRVGDRLVGVPIGHAVASAESWGLADAVGGDGEVEWFPSAETDGLVIAGCDPLLGLLSALVARVSADRVVAVHASTGTSIAALADGRVHGVLVHAPAGGLPVAPLPVRRWRVARWQVGLAGGGRSGPPSIEEVAERRLRVVQRDSGAGSQRAFERALRQAGAMDGVPGPVADGHVDVARRVAEGGGRVGVTMEAAARAFGLGFSPLEVHDVELWLDERWADLPAARDHGGGASDLRTGVRGARRGCSRPRRGLHHGDVLVRVVGPAAGADHQRCTVRPVRVGERRVRRRGHRRRPRAWPTPRPTTRSGGSCCGHRPASTHRIDRRPDRPGSGASPSPTPSTPPTGWPRKQALESAGIYSRVEPGWCTARTSPTRSASPSPPTPRSASSPVTGDRRRHRLHADARRAARTAGAGARGHLDRGPAATAPPRVRRRSSGHPRAVR
jgi:DNA-binding XRE family transcriptional regulator